MLGKLIKYEMRSVMRIMALVWLALPVASVVYGVGMRVFEHTDFLMIPLIRNLIGTFSTLLYAALFFALVVVSLVIIVARFYKGMLRNEGYLTHTLPVQVWKNITAKGIVALIISMISSIVALGSMFILAFIAGDIRLSAEDWVSIKRIVEDYPGFIGMFILFFIAYLVSTWGKIYTAYVSMAIGQLSNKYKLLLSVVAYIVIGTAVSVILVSGSATLATVIEIEKYVRMMETPEGVVTGMNLLSAAVIVVSLIQVAVFHFATEWLLRKKLNLE